jgi:ribosome-associated toxin RatA of RatAB toxin-antitoxin module
MADSTAPFMRAPYELGPMPMARRLVTIDEQLVRAPVARIFEIAALVEHWPVYLPHYRFVRFRERASDGGGLVEMSANRPFGPVGWPTWWLSEMSVDHDTPLIRFRHVGGVTTRMDVAWEFTPEQGDTRVRIVHTWDGPRWPLIGPFAATAVIGPVFVHGIASRTLAGLARVAERGEGNLPAPRGAAPADATRVHPRSDATRTGA